MENKEIFNGGIVDSERLVKLHSKETILTRNDIENYKLGIDLATGKDHSSINNDK